MLLSGRAEQCPPESCPDSKLLPGKTSCGSEQEKTPMPRSFSREEKREAEGWGEVFIQHLLCPTHHLIQSSQQPYEVIIIIPIIGMRKFRELR